MEFGPGLGDPEPKFGETFGLALFCQGSVLFARFLPGFARFLPCFAQFCPLFAPFCHVFAKNVRFLLVFARFHPVCQVRSVSPKFARIRWFSFIVRMRSSPKPGSDLRVQQMQNTGPPVLSSILVFPKPAS